MYDPYYSYEREISREYERDLWIERIAFDILENEYLEGTTSWDIEDVLEEVYNSDKIDEYHRLMSLLLSEKDLEGIITRRDALYSFLEPFARDLAEDILDRVEDFGEEGYDY